MNNVMINIENYKIEDSWVYIPFDNIILENINTIDEERILKYIENRKEDEQVKYPLNTSIILTNDCNLQCKYCYSKQQRNIDSLSFEMIKSLLDNIILNNITYALKSGKRRTPSVTFIGGGEPTMRWTLLEDSVNYINYLSRKNDIDIKITLCSNGQWFNEKRTEWLINNIDMIALSIDGDKNIQEYHRPGKSYGNSFDNIIKIIEYCIKKDFCIEVRPTISEFSIRHFDQIIRYFYDIGIKSIHVEPLNTNNKNLLKQPDPDMFVEKYLQNKTKYKNINIYTSLDVLNECRINKYCGFQKRNNIVLTPDGFLTSCIEISSKKALDFNYFYSGEIINNKITYKENKIFKTQNIRNKCESCIARYNCAGGCTKKSGLYKNEDNYDYFCYITKSILNNRLTYAINNFNYKIINNVKTINLNDWGDSYEF